MTSSFHELILSSSPEYLQEAISQEMKFNLKGKDSVLV